MVGLTMNNSYAMFFPLLYLILHGVISLAVLLVVAIGWRRHRKLGYLILVVWAIVALFSGLGSLYVPFLMRWLGTQFTSTQVATFIGIHNSIAHLVSGGLLLVGLALLVFGDKPAGGKAGAAPV